METSVIKKSATPKFHIKTSNCCASRLLKALSRLAKREKLRNFCWIIFYETNLWPIFFRFFFDIDIEVKLKLRVILMIHLVREKSENSSRVTLMLAQYVLHPLLER